jgi:hypothetical protein
LPENRRDSRGLRFNAPHDPAGLAETLRALALRAHRAIRTERTEETRRERDELRHALGRLESDCSSQGLNRLVPYVAALRREVETRLG